MTEENKDQTSETLTDYQRVCIPIGDGAALYGFVQMDGEEPVQTYACSMTPCTWVEGVAYIDADGDECDEGADSCYVDWRKVKRNLCGPIFDAEDLDEAREECSANGYHENTAGMSYTNPEGVKVHETAAKIVSALEDTVEQLDPTAEWSRVQAQVFPLGYTGDETLEDLQGKALSYLISRCGEVHSPADEKALRAECERIMAGVKA